MEKFDIRDGSLVNYLGEEADVIIPDGVTDISSFAFKHTPQLRRVSIPSSVRRIYERTFDNCPLLREVSLCCVSSRFGKKAGPVPSTAATVTSCSIPIRNSGSLRSWNRTSCPI